MFSKIQKRDIWIMLSMCWLKPSLTFFHSCFHGRLLQDLWESLKQGIGSREPSSGQFYKLRLLFLLTALRPELRLQLQQVKCFPSICFSCCDNLMRTNSVNKACSLCDYVIFQCVLWTIDRNVSGYDNHILYIPISGTFVTTHILQHDQLQHQFNSPCCHKRVSP